MVVMLALVVVPDALQFVAVGEPCDVDASMPGPGRSL
jgi:hypothetical protein